MQMITRSIPPSYCISCRVLMPLATSISHNDLPQPGNLTFCLLCGYLAKFGEDLSIQPLSDEDRRQIAADPELTAKVRRIRLALAAVRSTHPGSRL
jgi:hypothetical protein